MRDHKGSPQRDRTGREGRPPVLLLGDSLIFGGTEGQFVEVVRGLNRSRWGLHVGCVRAEGPHRARLEATGLHPLSCGRGAFRSPRFALAVVGLARDLRGRRIQLIHSFGFYGNILGVLAARLARVPAVIASQRELGDLRSPLQRWVHGVALRLAGHVVVNSEAVAERLKAARIAPAHRIVLIPNGVDLARFAPAPGSGAFRSDRVTVGTLAMLRPEKAVGDLVRAAPAVRERCPAARFVIWGDGLGRPELERLVREVGLERVVELRGATAQPEAALRDLDIFVLPSISEACSNALLEAMALGLPVVATRVGGIPALVEDGKTGLLVPPGEPSSLARAIIRLIEDPGLAAALAVRARERVQNEFGLDRMLARIDALYDRALTDGAT
jgi:glycosyltransferase involved in cell wall biosynthesis